MSLTAANGFFLCFRPILSNLEKQDVSASQTIKAALSKVRYDKENISRSILLQNISIYVNISLKESAGIPFLKSSIFCVN